MGWVATLTAMGIKPDRGFGAHGFHSAPKVFALKFLQPACLCLGRSWELRKFGLGEPLGKASLANTIYRLGRFVSTRDKSFCNGQGGYCYSSGVWSDEAMERGLARPLAKSVKTGGGRA